MALAHVRRGSAAAHSVFKGINCFAAELAEHVLDHVPGFRCPFFCPSASNKRLHRVVRS